MILVMCPVRKFIFVVLTAFGVFLDSQFQFMPLNVLQNAIEYFKRSVKVLGGVGEDVLNKVLCGSPEKSNVSIARNVNPILTLNG